MSERDSSTTDSATDSGAASDLESVIEADSLVEEVSIDGMCGVY